MLHISVRQPSTLRTQTGLRVDILLPQTPECWDYHIQPFFLNFFFLPLIYLPPTHSRLLSLLFHIHTVGHLVNTKVRPFGLRSTGKFQEASKFIMWGLSCIKDYSTQYMASTYGLGVSCVTQAVTTKSNSRYQVPPAVVD